MREFCLAIIPARGGSKGIKNKNIKPLLGKPLIAYTISEARKSCVIDKIIVSTDSPAIRDLAVKLGAETPFLRPARLAQDKTPMYPVVKHAVEFLEHKGENFEIIVVLQPTSPLRKAADIDGAITKLLTLRADSVVSLCLTEHSPYWMRVIRKGKVCPLMRARQYSRRQDLPKVYRLTGAIYATRRDVLFKHEAVAGGNTVPFIMPGERSIDIDTELDFKSAEIILGKSQYNQNRE